MAASCSPSPPVLLEVVEVPQHQVVQYLEECYRTTKHVRYYLEDRQAQHTRLKTYFVGGCCRQRAWDSYSRHRQSSHASKRGSAMASKVSKQHSKGSISTTSKQKGKDYARKATPKQPLGVQERLKRLFTSLCAQIDGGHYNNAIKTCDKSIADSSYFCPLDLISS